MILDRPGDTEFDPVAEYGAIRILAAGAAQAWTVAVGLAAAVSDFRMRQSDVEPTPVPGLAELVDRITEDFTDLSAILDAALSVAESPADAVAPVGVGRLGRDRLLHARIGTTTRRVAQAVLGATSLGAGTDDTLRLELAASVALTDRSAVPLVADGPVELFATTRDDLVLEVAGVVARLLVDWGGAVALRTADGAGVDLEVDGDVVVVTPHALPPGPGIQRWSSPVVIADLAGGVVATLVEGAGIETALEIEATVIEPHPSRRAHSDPFTGTVADPEGADDA